MTMVAANRLCLTCGIEYSGFISVCPEDQTRLTVLTQDERVGTVLADRYDILEIIGTGGMGTVYKARQRLINRIVAVKMLHKTMMTSADVLRRFQLEAQAASRLSLPNILTIYDFGLTEEGQPYMVMDYLNGTSLDKIILSQHHLEPIRALNIFIQACAALAHAHQHEVLHRDIKPSNIMLVNFDDQSDFVKIVDFGIAKMMNKIEGQAAELTKTGEVYGSPPYMSPEQCRGLELDSRADIYSLACVLYKSLVGKNPMQSNGDSMPLQIMLKHINEKAPSFAEAAPDLFLPNKLETIVFKALEKNPDDRYQTMLEFKEALEKVRDSLVADSRAGQPKPLEEVDTVGKSQSPAGAETPNNKTDVAAPQPLPRPRKQIIDDPTPHLPTAMVPFDQQLSPTPQSASLSTANEASTAVAAHVTQPDPAQWPEVSQGMHASSTPEVAPPRDNAPPHNLSPSEFLSTLNSQLTQSALAPSAKSAPQPVASSVTAASANAQTFTPNATGAPVQVNSATPAPLTPPQITAPPAPQSIAPPPSTPDAASQQPAKNQLVSPPPVISVAVPASSPVAAKPANNQALPPSPASELSAVKPAAPVARATFAEALQAAQPTPDTQMLSIVQAPPAASAPVKPNVLPAAESAAPLQERRAKVLSQQSLPAQPVSPPVPKAPLKPSISQTLKEMPVVPVVPVTPPPTPVVPKIPAAVLDDIKTPKPPTAQKQVDTPPVSPVPDRAQTRSVRGKYDDSGDTGDRLQRLSENRRKFIKHETDSSKTMLVIAGLAFIVILSAFFSFSYFNSLPRQAQTVQEEATNSQTASVPQKAFDTNKPAVSQSNEIKPTAPAPAAFEPIKPATSAVSSSSSSVVSTTSAPNITSEIASVAPVTTKIRKTRKPHTAAVTPAPSGPVVRRHAYSSYGMQY